MTEEPPVTPEPMPTELGMAPENAERHRRFMARFDEVINLMRDTVDTRGSEYNVVSPIQDLTVSPGHCVGMAQMKLIRAHNQLAVWHISPSEKTKTNTIDSLIDAMAYMAFAAAWLEE